MGQGELRKRPQEEEEGKQLQSRVALYTLDKLEWEVLARGRRETVWGQKPKCLCRDICTAYHQSLESVRQEPAMFISFEGWEKTVPNKSKGN